MKSTHSGECQLCGRRQLLPSNLLSLHGYTVEWGFFDGICPGSKAQPFELSKDLIADRIKHTDDAIAAQVALIQRYTDIADPVHDRPFYRHYDGGTNSRKGGYVWLKVDVVDFTKVTYADMPNFVTYKASVQLPDGYQDFHRRNVVELDAYSEARTLDSARKWAFWLNQQYSKRVLQPRLNQLESYRSWLINREASWTLKPLTPRANKA